MASAFDVAGVVLSQERAALLEEDPWITQSATASGLTPPSGSPARYGMGSAPPRMWLPAQRWGWTRSAAADSRLRHPHARRRRVGRLRWAVHAPRRAHV